MDAAQLLKTSDHGGIVCAAQRLWTSRRRSASAHATTERGYAVLAPFLGRHCGERCGVALKATPRRGRPRSSLDSHPDTAQDGLCQEGATMTLAPACSLLSEGSMVMVASTSRCKHRLAPMAAPAAHARAVAVVSDGRLIVTSRSDPSGQNPAKPSVQPLQTVQMGPLAAR